MPETMTPAERADYHESYQRWLDAVERADRDPQDTETVRRYREAIRFYQRTQSEAA